MPVSAIIGAVFVDVKGFSSVKYVPTGRNVGHVRIVHGGVCRNVCEAFAQQGEKARFVSMTDSTALGRDVRDHLSGLGVDLTHTLFSESGMGIWMAILDSNGDLAGSISHQPVFTALEEYVDQNIESILESVDAAVLEIDMSAHIAESVLRAARKLKKPVFAIVGNMEVILAHPEYLRDVSCFFCNEIEAGRLFRTDFTTDRPDQVLAQMPENMYRRGIRKMVITMGAYGAVYFDATTGESGHCPAIPTSMVDSTGAGDAFFSGSVMALNRGFSLGSAVRVGTRLASATIGCENSVCGRVEGLFDDAEARA